MSNFVGNKSNPLSLAIQGARKLVTKVAQKASGQKKTTGLEGIKYIKPSKGVNLEGEIKKRKLIAKSDVQKKFKPGMDKIAADTRDIRKTLQGMRGEKITKSGISKGKDVSKGIYESKLDVDKRNKGSQKLFEAAKGRKQLKFGGSSTMKSNVQKIKETFKPKGNVPNKYKGFSKLPEAVQQKINKKLAKKV